ncbi:ROK family protein [Bengtsoniella intestinalis]|uniref:ROK family protein n=1 Tax=Bengtsoniella intestinalis TaxID=3073143 RepID=UPI00391F2466
MLVGIDVGGTNLKAGLVSKDGQMLAVEKWPVTPFEKSEDFVAQLVDLCRIVCAKQGVDPATLDYVGMGIPGAVKAGEITYTCNLPLQGVAVEALFRKEIDVPVLLENDANCAAVGEYLLGAGRGTTDFTIITLGTGVGGGFIVGGKLYSGGGMVGEVGHMVIEKDGAPCGCGRHGCWETYSSATGLIRLTKEAMAAHPDSALHTVAQEQGGVSGRTAFDTALTGDAVAVALCNTYVEYLACGAANLCSILQPEVLAVGGGVADAPAHLLMEPLAKMVESSCYAANVGTPTRVVKAQLGNDAGILGAALLKQVL